MVITGKSYWAAITTPNTTFEPVWSIDLAVDSKTKKELEEAGLKAKMVEGEARFKFKRKVHKKDGSMNKRPVLLDADGKETSVQIGNGSLVMIQTTIKDWKYGTKTGTSADLQGVKILELVEYGGGAPDGAELGMSADGAEIEGDELFDE